MHLCESFSVAEIMNVLIGALQLSPPVAQLDFYILKAGETLKTLMLSLSLLSQFVVQHCVRLVLNWLHAGAGLLLN